MDGYKKILNTIYSPKYYYERVMRFMKDFEPKKKKVFHLNPNYILALFKSIYQIGSYRRGKNLLLEIIFLVLVP